MRKIQEAFQHLEKSFAEVKEFRKEIDNKENDLDDYSNKAYTDQDEDSDKDDLGVNEDDLDQDNDFDEANLDMDESVAEDSWAKISEGKVENAAAMEKVKMEEQGTEDDTPIEDTVSKSDGLPLEEESDSLDILRIEIAEDNSEEKDDAGNALQGQNKTLQLEIDKHKKQLEILKQKVRHVQ